MKAIIRKELADHFGSTRFMLLMSLVFMISFLGVFLAGQGIREVLAGGGGYLLRDRTFLLLFTAPGAFMPLTAIMALFGPLVGLILGFDAINRERNQGTLSKILAQPVYRDEVILGKYLAGLITIGVLLTALFLILTGLGMTGVGLVPTIGELARLAIFWLMSVVYLGFWLGLAILASIAFRSVATSALAAAVVWILLGFFVPVLGQTAAAALTPLEDPARPRAEELAAYDHVSRLFSLASPPALFGEAAVIMLDPTHRGSEQALRLSTMSRLDRLLLNRFQGVLSVAQSLILAIPDLLVLIAFSLATFLGSYLVFVKQEVRSA
ncbi:MAG: ABC transporter permease [Deltaproteobacteria bacterium]|nr:ABC transporter permease [Deltaproteobacteria bacterium]